MAAMEAEQASLDDDLESFFDKANAEAAALIQNPDYVKLEGGTHENARQACNVALAGIIGVGTSACAESDRRCVYRAEELMRSSRCEPPFRIQQVRVSFACCGLCD